MPLSIEQVKDALNNTKLPNFVCPVEPAKLGKYAFRYGLDIQPWWNKLIVGGWEVESFRCFNELEGTDIAAALAFTAALE